MAHRRRRNGSSAALIRTLCQRCGLDREAAEKLAPKKDMRSPRRALSPDQLRVFRAGVRRYVDDVAVRTILLMLPVTGLRVAEACGLQARAVAANASKRALQVGVVGKGEKFRVVPLRAQGTRLLSAYLRERPPSSAFLFQGPRGGRITPETVQAACRLIAERTGLRGLTPHVLRHTFATQALLNCWDLHRLQAILGHGKEGSKRLPPVTLTYLDV